MRALHTTQDTLTQVTRRVTFTFSALALIACADELTPVDAVGGRAPLAGAQGGGLEWVGGVSGGAPEEMVGEGALPTPPPAGGEESDPPVYLSPDPIDLVGFGLLPPSDEPVGGAEAGAWYTEASPCALPEIDFPVTHPFAQGVEVPRPRERATPFEWRVERAGQVTQVAHPQLSAQPPALRTVDLTEGSGRQRKVDLVMPSFTDEQGLFERAELWSGERCYEVRPGEGGLLTEEEAYQRYRRLVLDTLWRPLDERPEHRSVIGLRGASPGMISWNYNSPNLYNDTIVLLWRDQAGRAHVLELPVNTDTGAHDFGADSSSSLRANRHYPYVNGWHRDYNALRIDLPSYPVRDDTNNNGHWDSDRNGWLDGPQPGLDYDRLGTAHNIHGAPSSVALASAEVNIASAGCQVIPGAENWERFISQAWTGLGDPVDYYLIDVRDVPQRFFEPCVEDGSHACPYSIRSFPFNASDDTSMSSERAYDLYSCDDANEGGAERVYVMNLPSAGLLRATVETASSSIDPDLHLLDGDDAQACRARGHLMIEERVPAGRYVLIVDTYVSGEGAELSGPYELLVEWAPEG